ncbi:hypothetical protein Dsin_032173 [Dipteronia sinensis]|uniref:SWIM-type domain-containing protein n=1 Tax=Dipteronia sinensis TaxID=43782 RepID=A0AAD9ZMV1_9ROSI|nr:hypothetical protein Dsin_032173 [Dipteronia sinensis]
MHLQRGLSTGFHDPLIHNSLLKQKSCGWVLRAWKSNKGTYWHVKSFVNEHTCDRNDNYNIEFKRVSASVMWDLYASKFGDHRRRIGPKDIVSKMREQHRIHLSYNKAYWSKEHTLNHAFGDPWESFQRLPAYFYVLEQSNPGTVTKIKTDSKNRFKYGFMAIGASIEGFNSVIRPFICIDATHLKARTRGILLVAVCKDINEMIYPLAFGFANSECTESWTWFLKKLRKLIQYPDRVIFCKQRDDVIWLYYRATYAYRVEEFDSAMAELKETYCKVYDELMGVGVEKFSLVHSPRKRYFSMTTNIAESMNSCLLSVRKLPITAIAYHNEHIKDRTETSHRCKIHPIDFNTFKVDDKWKEATVDLDERSCSCRQWDLDELPCSHAIAVASVEWFVCTFMVLYGLVGKGLWCGGILKTGVCASEFESRRSTKLGRKVVGLRI